MEKINGAFKFTISEIVKYIIIIATLISVWFGYAGRVDNLESKTTAIETKIKTVEVNAKEDRQEIKDGLQEIKEDNKEIQKDIKRLLRKR